MAAGSLREVDALLADQEGSAGDGRGEHRCHQQHGARAKQLHQPAAKPGAADASHRLQDVGETDNCRPTLVMFSVALYCLVPHAVCPPCKL